MKNLKIYVSAFALLAFASSCKKSFLDEQPSEKVSTEQEQEEVKKDPKLLDARVSGLYTTMYEDFTGDFTNGTTQNHDDFGQKGYDIYSDMLSADLLLGATNYGWYTNLERYQSTKNSASSTDYQPYRYYYKIIYAANTVIDVLGGNNATLANDDVKHYMGQAKAMRAYAYFYLANLYSPKGYGTGAEKILPILTSTNQAEVPMSTSAQVYTQIISDLDQANSLLADFTRPDKNHIDSYVAKGLLAYALAARGTNADLTRVISLTDSVLAKYPLTTPSEVVANLDGSGHLTNPQSGFNNIATPSWIWGADITLSSNLDLVSWWGQMDIFTYSYAWAGDPKFIDDSLYKSIRPTDIRKKQFDDNPDYGGLLPTGKFFNENREEGGQRNITDDYIYMRADEMVLLNAEAKVRLGDDGGARTEIKLLLAQRFPSALDYAYIDLLTGNDLKEEIYLQTRIELWGEGKTYLAMKRNKHSVTKGSNHLFLVGETFQYDAPELTFVTPSGEFLYNPNLTK
ncbi:RagB/SusD family nutrient uptake outer membrane protein [Mucilaginibacter panaciglaebae]|uniref:RagB/SusD family nutrient uptake outer membrane protein n=1 Tax=Mucilaginibacter panaciglaebae TaxID=502331 RepID=A0ABP7WZ17_9SPHI